MIPQISEINFPEYATLHEATASFADMGERTITTQVRIDGDVVPDFDGWELEFKGERFVLPIKDPQARKDNTTRNSLVDLTFYSWPIYQMKRYFFFETTTSATGTVMADKYKASVNLNLVDFVSLFNRVLDFYFDGKIVADLASGSYSPQTAFAQIDYSYIWDVLQNFYELYGVRWRIVYDLEEDIYTIKIGYPADVIEDHNFEYGFEGGLLHFERQIEDDNIKNILLGRGGEKNIPYRYFKKIDPNNPEWAADPDAIKELENVYFDRLRDSNFRNYIQGWKTNPLRALYPGESVETYDEDRGERDWAYKKGHEDTSFDPVEYVKDEDSIEKYGERWGAIDDNDEIYPTIQGLDILDLGRVDEVVAVSDIITDDIQAKMETAAEIVSIDGVTSQTDDIPVGSYNQRSIRGGTFTVPSDKKANVLENGFFAIHESASEPLLSVDTSLSKIRIYDADTDEEIISGDQGLSEGTYYYVIDITIRNSGSITLRNVTFGVNGLKLQVSDESPEAWKPTFDIWIKNIFDTERETGESDEEYSLRVWKPILGDRLRNEAKVVFSDGPMSISEDYEFTVASYPVPDNTKVTAGGYRSEWKMSLYKSDAEYNVSGLYIPNNTSSGKPVAGNHFFFIGIDMPHMYVTLNEEKLSGYKTLALGGMTEVNPTWVISLDKVRADVINNDEQRFFDQISVGCELHVKDKRFTANEVLTLFANSITYSWHEPTDGQPYILPDIEIVVSDRIIVEKSSSDTMRGDIENIKSTYAKLSDMSTIIPRLTSQSFLKKNGEEELSLSPTKFASLLTSRDFSQGALGGKGWGFYKDNSSQFQEPELQPAEAPSRAQALMAAPAEEPASEYVPDSVLEVDKVIVRKEMQVNNLVVNQISSVGGKQILSAASIECVQVVENTNSYDCYFDQKQGTVKNLFAVNDIAMGQVFTPENTESRYYKMLVTAVDVDHITLSKTGKVGSGVPKKGDIIVQYGNTTNPARQYIIVRDVIGGGYEKMLSGLSALNSNGQEYYFAGYDPRLTGNNRARFFVGNDRAHMEFDQSRSRFTVKGGIVQSPSGDNFPVPCNRGDWLTGSKAYYGDLFFFEGQGWLCIAQTAIDEAHAVTTAPAAGANWQLYSKKGGDGQAGTSPYSLDLSNGNMSVNADSSGTIYPSGYRPSCTATLYYGSSPATGVTYSISVPSGASGISINSSTGVITLASGLSFSGDSIEVAVTAKIANDAKATAILNITKAKAGTNAHEPRISSTTGNWEFWSDAQGGYVDSGHSATGDDGHSPYIGSNGNWYEWNGAIYVDTGIKAEGVDGDDGDDAVSYEIRVSADQITVDKDGNPSPSSISATAWKIVGAQNPVSATDVTIKLCYIKRSDGARTTPTTASSVTITSNIINTYSHIVFGIYKNGVLWGGEEETIPILRDGQNGGRGPTLRGPVDLTNPLSESRWFYSGKNGEAFQDLCVRKEGDSVVWYACETSYQGNSFDSTKWSDGSAYRFVATEILFANQTLIKNGIIEYLKTRSTGERIESMLNWLKMFDASNNEKLLITGEDIDLDPPTLTHGYNTQKIYTSEWLYGGGHFNVPETTILTFSKDSAHNAIAIGTITVRIDLDFSDYDLEPNVDARVYARLYQDSTPIWEENTGDVYRESGASHITLKIDAASLTSASSGTYYLKIESSLRAQMGSDEAIRATYNVLSSAVYTSKNSEAKVSIGANGMAISNGNGFISSFGVVDGTQQILFQGKRPDGRAVGILINASGAYFNQGNGWELVGTDGGGTSGGSNVTWDQIVTSGTHIADIFINGIRTAVYAPSGSSGSYLPLSGGTMTGDIAMGANKVKFGTYNAAIYASGDDLYLAAGNSSGRVVSTTTFHDSDERLKDIIKSVDFSIDDLRSIPKVLFAWKDDETKREQIGTIAQGLKDKFPQLVTVGKDGMYAVNYDALGVLALHGIDLLAEENHRLEERLRKIEEKLGL